MINSLGMANNRLSFDARVMIVDKKKSDRADERRCFESIAGIFHNDNDFELIEAEKCEEAIEKLKEYKYKVDLLVTNWSLASENDGLAIARLGIDNGIPVAIISEDENLKKPSEDVGMRFILKSMLFGDIKKIAAEVLYNQKK